MRSSEQAGRVASVPYSALVFALPVAELGFVRPSNTPNLSMRYLRWILPFFVGVLVVCLALFFILKACGVTLTGIVFTAGPHKVTTLDGIIWLLPWENEHHSEGAGFVYEGASVAATEKGGVLTVNGKYYGTLTTGDSVDLSTRGVVLVNGQPRQPR